MHYSGLIVSCNPSSLDACVADLQRCSGLDIYVSDENTGRIVVVLETQTLPEQETTMRQVQALQHVRTADLVYHYFGDEPDQADDWANENEDLAHTMQEPQREES